MLAPLGALTHRRPLTQGLEGRRSDAISIRNEDHSASGIAPLAVRDGMTNVPAFPVMRRSLSTGSVSCRRQCLPRVPREANARRPSGALRYLQGCPARAEVHARTKGRAKLAKQVQPLPVSVDWLRPRDASALNGAVPRKTSRTTIQATNKCCRRATANSLRVPPSLAATGSQEISPVYEPPTSAAHLRQLLLTGYY